MSVAGIKKRYHKTHQLLSEKITGVEGTKLDDDFQEMERKIHITDLAVTDLLSKTTGYLQPNPAHRAKLEMLNSMSKISGQFKHIGYPQTEALLGDCMLLYGTELGKESAFGKALKQAGECMRQMADVKDCFDFTVKQNFLDPLHSLKAKELKDISIEQVNQLAVFMEAILNYHKQSANILGDLHERFQKHLNRQPPPEEPQHTRFSLTAEESYTEPRQPMSVYRETCQEKGYETHKKDRRVSFSPGCTGQLDQPCCRALYDFEPESEGELRFKEGDIVTLTNQLDDNWFEGMLNNESGFFPINHVEVLVHLPK
ncbi:endophilin-A3 isoform X2 [Lissotriton helveticus]